MSLPGWVGRTLRNGLSTFAISALIGAALVPGMKVVRVVVVNPVSVTAKVAVRAPEQVVRGKAEYAKAAPGKVLAGPGGGPADHSALGIGRHSRGGTRMPERRTFALFRDARDGQIDLSACGISNDRATPMAVFVGIATDRPCP